MEPVRKPHRYAPSPSQRKHLRTAARWFDGLTDRTEIGRATAEEAARLVHAQTAALVVRSVEGPRVLWQDPGGPDPVHRWGPATLAALLAVGVPVREVLQGDPLADGGATSLLAVPVPCAGMLAGTVLARRGGDHGFSVGEEDVLVRLARMAGVALEVAARRGRTAVESGADPVTGFWPRERLLIDLRSALRSAALHGMPVTLLLVEVTGLAELRRTVGRVSADEALSDVAAVLGRRLRVGDLAYRFGHDEVAVLLPLTDSVAAAAVAARVSAMPLAQDADLPERAVERARRLADLVGVIGLRTAWTPVEGRAEDVVLDAVRALAAAARAAR